MPTPIGHALGGIVAGCIAGPTSADVPLGRRRVPVLLFFALLGMLPDIDLLISDSHRQATHSLVAACAVGLLAVVVAPGRPWVWLASAAAYGSHLLLDWLGSDTVAPLGIMALWPFETTHFESPYHWFYPVCREYWLLDCWVGLVWSVWYELLIIGPLALASVLLTRRRRPGR
jgi:membrane-bound metal-dependent hydrolase YbcI (DUF457 family)